MQLAHDIFVIECSNCAAQFSADLARYWNPCDGEGFACTWCDHPWMALRPLLPNADTERPLAQRRPAREKVPA